MTAWGLTWLAWNVGYVVALAVRVRQLTRGAGRARLLALRSRLGLGPAFVARAALAVAVPAFLWPGWAAWAWVRALLRPRG